MISAEQCCRCGRKLGFGDVCIVLRAGKLRHADAACANRKDRLYQKRIDEQQRRTQRKAQ